MIRGAIEAEVWLEICGHPVSCQCHKCTQAHKVLRALIDEEIDKVELEEGTPEGGGSVRA